MSEMITLLLAWKLAEKFGEDQAAAVRKCANNLYDQVPEGDVKTFFGLVRNKDNSDFKVVEAVRSSYVGMRLSGVL
ncbi:hypothetical protein vBAmePPT11V19_00055 [Alteromonas phage vB_AmeP_PT11-V19]|nr:hypothetical protein vBAmePPT11V19_00055 [Alteromonas phage vB_AmeP_PT11-V19]